MLCCTALPCTAIPCIVLHCAVLHGTALLCAALALSCTVLHCAARLTLSLVRQPWFEPPAGPLAAVVRCQLDSYPFRQMPRYVEEGNVDLVQSMVG